MNGRRGSGGLRLVLGLLAAVQSAGCEEPAGLPSGWITDPEAGQIVVRFGADPVRYALDAWSLDSARTEGDTLRLRVRHGGGCARHRYALVAWNGWLESFPVQAGLLLAHDARGDACDALLLPVLRFDLTPLREAYRRAYDGEHGTIVLRLSDPARPAATLRTLSWTF
jgi:hypothetical protein